MRRLACKVSSTLANTEDIYVWYLPMLSKTLETSLSRSWNPLGICVRDTSHALTAAEGLHPQPVNVPREEGSGTNLPGQVIT